MVTSQWQDSRIVERRLGTDRRNVLAITAVWLGLATVANPIGDFPLGDDWAFGWTVKTLVEGGGFQLSDWTGMNLLPQAFWGALFSLPLGFSFTALRLSTLVLGLVGALATYGVLREVKADPAISLVGAVVVALNPLYFALSHTFNSDVPSFALTLCSLYFLLRGLNNDATLDVGVGIAVALVSTMNRQSGIVVLPAFGLALLIKRGVGVRTGLLAVIPTAAGLTLNAVYSQWLEVQGHKPILFGAQTEQLLRTFSGGIAHVASTYVVNLTIMAGYLGLFLVPFMIVAFGSFIKHLTTRDRKIAIGVVLAGAAVGTAFIREGRQMPFAWNWLDSFALGPPSLYGYNTFLSPNALAVIAGVWKILTVAAMAGAAILLGCAGRAVAVLIRAIRGPSSDRTWQLVLIGGAALLYLALIAGLDRGYWFDRYLILLLPLCMAVAILVHDREPYDRPASALVAVALTALVLAGTLTVAATHDYLSWNRTRWQALNDLMRESRLSATQIEGGFEFDGWFLGQRLETCAPERTRSASTAALGWGAFTCLSGTWNHPYTISFVPRPGYKVVDERSFQRWLPWRREKLYVLKTLD